MITVVKSETDVSVSEFPLKVLKMHSRLWAFKVVFRLSGIFLRLCHRMRLFAVENAAAVTIQFTIAEDRPSHQTVPKNARNQIRQQNDVAAFVRKISENFHFTISFDDKKAKL